MTEIKKKQFEFMDWEFGAFFHFGIRTFYEGHKDWDMKEMPLDGFNPRKLDCEQWIKTVKTAGAKYAILVCKHHDGFANWPSKYTEYSVANTPWRDGNGDVVREFVDACKKHDVRVGLYYSPAQFGSCEIDSKEYDDYFINQISELLENYGEIDYLWFDGCGSENHQYDTARIIKEIRKRQPNILIFNMWDPDTRWVGNESGLVQMPNDNMVDSLDFSVLADEKDKLSDKRFLPGECDCRIRLKNWFYSENDLSTLKSVDELLGLYHYSVGRGANLLLNIAPNRDGLLPDEDSARVLEFGERVRAMFSDSLGGMEQTVKDGDIHTISLGGHTLIDSVVIEEKMDGGEKIESFEIYVYPYPYYGNGAIYVYGGKTVGHKHICRFAPVRTEKVEIVVTKSRPNYEIKDINLYYTGDK